MKRLAACFLLFAIGCKADPSTIVTESIRLKASVAQAVYVPATHGHTSGGLGFDSNLDLHVHPSQSVDYPETWSVVLKFEDGKCYVFHGKTLYEKAVVGRVVEVVYVDTYRVSGETKTWLWQQLQGIDFGS